MGLSAGISRIAVCTVVRAASHASVSVTPGGDSSTALRRSTGTMMPPRTLNWGVPRAAHLQRADYPVRHHLSATLRSTFRRGLRLGPRTRFCCKPLWPRGAESLRGFTKGPGWVGHTALARGEEESADQTSRRVKTRINTGQKRESPDTSRLGALCQPERPRKFAPVCLAPQALLEPAPFRFTAGARGPFRPPLGLTPRRYAAEVTLPKALPRWTMPRDGYATKSHLRSIT